MNMKPAKAFLILIALFVSATSLFGQTRREINLPHIPGYMTLKCDFHMHTPFSDGSVLPADRVTEAWMEGLDAMAITDHLEYHPWAEDIPVKFNRSYALAKSRAEELDMVLIHAAEITRSMPPGHLNALFLEDEIPLTHDDPMKAIEEAAKQNAFIFWNHPGWKGQQPDGVARWYDEHTEILEKGWLKGIEVVNDVEYYPAVFQWALDKNLTMLGNSDIHPPVHFHFERDLGEHRPLTLVFAKTRTQEGVREALEAGRTAIYHEDKLIGRQEYLIELFNNMVTVKNAEQSVPANGTINLQVYNNSDIDLLLKANGGQTNYGYPKEIKLYAQRTVYFSVKVKKAEQAYQKMELPFMVKNMLVGPDKGLPVQLNADLINLHALQLKPGKKSGELRIEKPELPEGFSFSYTLDGKTWQPIDEKIKSENSIKLQIRAVKNGRHFGNIISKQIEMHKALGKKVDLQHQPNPKYAGSGKYPLTDGQLGSGSYSDGQWLGFEKDDLVATLDLGKKQSISTISARFLMEQKSWIFLPPSVTIEVSADGKQYTNIKTATFAADNNDNKLVETVQAAAEGKYRYVKISAQNLAECPQWHAGAGGKAWLFVDEIVVN